MKTAPDFFGVERCCELYLQLSERESDQQKRFEAANKGLVYARKLKALRPHAAHGFYFYAVLYRQRMLNRRRASNIGLKLVFQQLKKAAQLNEHYQHGGAYRVLGRLYAEAPKPPVSEGSFAEASFHFKEAQRVASHWPENYLDYAKILLENGNIGNTEKQLDLAESLLLVSEPRPWSTEKHFFMSSQLEALRHELTIKKNANADQSTK